ncbi:MAG: CvpA family protein [Clostridiaceae bacterium]|nr:CvpA family protein [Clostridiaceae bacterium]
MNWSDLIVIAVIVVFGLIGMSKGFIYSMFRLASFFVAAIVSVKCYPVLSNILDKTAVFTNIKSGIYKNLMLQQTAQSPQINEGTRLTAGAVIDNLNLPGFLKNMVEKNMLEKIPDLTKLVDIANIMDGISNILAHMVIDILSVVLLYIAVRIGLIFLRFILQGIAKLPVFKQMDKLGGFAFGALEGLMTVYIVFTILMLFSASPAFKDFFDAVEGSLIAKFFYQNNFIVDWMFPKDVII